MRGELRARSNDVEEDVECGCAVVGQQKTKKKTVQGPVDVYLNTTMCSWVAPGQWTILSLGVIHEGAGVRLPSAMRRERVVPRKQMVVITITQR